MNHGTHLDTLRLAIRQHEHIVEETVAVVPHLSSWLSPAIHGAGNPQKMLDEFVDELLIVGSRRAISNRHGEHVEAEEGHPCRAIGLLEITAGGQRLLRSKTPMLSSPKSRR